jgi:hypothetical protein
MPGTVSGGMLNGVFGLTTSSCAPVRDGRAAGEPGVRRKAGAPPGRVGACRNVLTIVAMSWEPDGPAP